MPPLCNHGYYDEFCVRCKVKVWSQPSPSELIREISDEVDKIAYPPMTDERWAHYHGFLSADGKHVRVEDWRRVVHGR